MKQENSLGTAEELVAQMIADAPNPLEEVLSELVRDSEESACRTESAD